MGGKISAHRVVPVLAEMLLVGRYRLSELLACGQPGVEMRGDVMDARTIAETFLLALIAVTAGALVPDFLRHIKMRTAKYGRRATDL
jgi:hypothetical protein